MLPSYKVDILYTYVKLIDLNLWKSKQHWLVERLIHGKSRPGYGPTLPLTLNKEFDF